MLPTIKIKIKLLKMDFSSDFDLLEYCRQELLKNESSSTKDLKNLFDFYKANKKTK